MHSYDLSIQKNPAEIDRIRISHEVSPLCYRVDSSSRFTGKNWNQKLFPKTKR